MATTASAAGVVAELRARLRRLRAVLTEMGFFVMTGRKGDTLGLKRAWWRTDAVCWWLLGSRDAAEDVAKRFREGAEAIVLLGALARFDFIACMEEIRATWPLDSGEMTRYAPAVPWIEIGFSYLIYRLDGIEGITERIASVQPPSQAFVDDYAWMKNAFSILGEEKTHKLPSVGIPVKLVIRWGDDSAEKLPYLLRRLLPSIAAATTMIQPVDDDVDQATAVTRFRIVEIDLGETRVNAESLTYLAELKQFGVRVARLTSLYDEDATEEDLLSVANALHTLFPPQCATVTGPVTEEVYVTHPSKSLLMPAIFSAIHASRDLTTVNVEVFSDPDVEGYEALVQPGTARALWRWAAYTLFSRHANQHVQNIVVYVEFVRRMLGEIEQILRADNPLAELFEAKCASDNQWMSATRFYIRDPFVDERDHLDNSTLELFVSPSPLPVRVVDCHEIDRSKWWRVLLPGCGLAWVKDEDATMEPTERGIKTADGRLPTNSIPHLKFRGIYPRNVGNTVALLRLLPRGVDSIELEAGVYAHEEAAVTMDDWTIEVLRLFPDLERLKLPCTMEV